MSTSDVPATSPEPQGEDLASASDRSGILAAAGGVVQAVTSTLAKGGQASAGAVSRSAEGAATTLTGRVIRSALAQPRTIDDTTELARALVTRPTGASLAGPVVAMAARAASKFGALRFLTRRTPMWLLASLVPALWSAMARGTNELSALASYLALRARSEGIEPEPGRLETAVVQLALGQPVDPGLDVRHGPLVLRWLGSGAWGVLALGNRGRSDPRRLAAAASAVPPSILGGSEVRALGGRSWTKGTGPTSPSRCAATSGNERGSWSTSTRRSWRLSPTVGGGEPSGSRAGRGWGWGTATCTAPSTTAPASPTPKPSTTKPGPAPPGSWSGPGPGSPPEGSSWRACSPTTDPATAPGSGPKRATEAVSATTGSAPTGPRPTARWSGSTASSSKNGPTSAPGDQKPNEPTGSTISSTSTT